MNQILKVDNLTVRYGSGDNRTHAVQGVSFHIGPGELFGIIGESGSGKSTICRAVMGHIRADVAGSIRFGENDMLRLPATELRRFCSRRISLLPQGISALNPLITVGRHITETLQTHLGVSRKAAKARALSLLKTFQLPDAERIYHAHAYQLSGGMARRVVMAIAFACEPRLVVADEPTRGLDARLCEEIIHTLRHTVRRQRTAVLIVTHNLNVAALCDRIAVLYRGRFAETGRTEKVLAQPGHAYTRSLIDARPSAWGSTP